MGKALFERVFACDGILSVVERLDERLGVAGVDVRPCSVWTLCVAGQVS